MTVYLVTRERLMTPQREVLHVSSTRRLAIDVARRRAAEVCDYRSAFVVSRVEVDALDAPQIVWHVQFFNGEFKEAAL